MQRRAILITHPSFSRGLIIPSIPLQLSRNAADRAPRLADLRDSGTLEQDGDIVIFLDRPAMRGKAIERKGDNVAVDLTNLLVIDVAKQRQGPRGESYFEYHPDRNALFDWSEEKFR